MVSDKKESTLEYEKAQALSVSEMRVDINSYMKSCIKDSVEKTISETGIGMDLMEDYKEQLRYNIKSCSNYLFDILKGQGYEINEKEIDINIELDQETMFIDLSYPLVFKKNNHKTKFNKFSQTFDRSERIRINNGYVDTAMKITSKNRKADLLLPSGLQIIDSEGNYVEYLGIRIEDLHFDNLNNGVVVGKTIYEGLPDGAKFSEPIQVSIEFDESDIPEGYTKENIMVAWWNKDIGLWFGVPTKIEGNRAIGVITHFTEISIVVGVSTTVTPKTYSDWLLPYRYSDLLCDIYTTNCRCAGEAWTEGGTTFPKPESSISDYNDLRTISGLSYNGQDHNSMITYGFDEIDCEDPATYQDILHHIFIDNVPYVSEVDFPTYNQCYYPPDISGISNRGSPDCNGISPGVNGNNNCGTCVVDESLEELNNYISTQLLIAKKPCICLSPTEINENQKMIGIDSKCFSATVTGEQGYVDEVIIKPLGDASFNPSRFFVSIIERDATCELLNFNDVEIDGQIHETYPWRLAINKDGFPVIQTSGIKCLNTDNNVCASGGIQYTYHGEGRVTTDEEYEIYQAKIENRLAKAR